MVSPKGANIILTPFAPFGDTKEGDLPATGVTRGYSYSIPSGYPIKSQHSFQPLIHITNKFKIFYFSDN
jgi:hypothetical protein